MAEKTADFADLDDASTRLIANDDLEYTLSEKCYRQSHSSHKWKKWLVLTNCFVLIIVLLLEVARTSYILKSGIVSTECCDAQALELTTGSITSDRDQGQKLLNTVFEKKDLLESLAPDTNTAWRQSVLPPGGGFLWVKTTNKTISSSLRDFEPFGISMLHGMHCLDMIRNNIQNAMLGTFNNATTTHLGHCIGYIAQHLLCAADGTIERPITTNDSAGNPVVHATVNGYGTTHRCRDTSRIWEVSAQSLHHPVEQRSFQPGDTIDSVFS